MKKTENKNLISIGMMFNADDKKYKVVDFEIHFDGIKRIEYWIIQFYEDGGQKIRLTKNELDKKIINYKEDNQHIIFN